MHKSGISSTSINFLRALCTNDSLFRNHSTAFQRQSLALSTESRETVAFVLLLLIIIVIRLIVLFVDGHCVHVITPNFSQRRTARLVRKKEPPAAGPFASDCTG